MATHFSFDSYVAQVVEASVEKNGNVRVHRVVCAVDCGRTINPDIVKAQMEGGIIFGLTAALKTEITLENGRVQQTNFHDYQMLRMFETPEIEVHIVPSEENPTGVGEPGVPPVQEPTQQRDAQQVETRSQASGVRSQRRGHERQGNPLGTRWTRPPDP